MIFSKVLFVATAYLFGAIPVGFLLVKLIYKTDIREHGSGNPGATNVWRTFGKKPGATTLALDVMKGALPVLAAQKFFPYDSGVAIISGLASIIGHNWSVFLRGKGGKGVATSIGVFLALIPLPSLAALGLFLLVFFTTGYVSTGSMAGAIGLVAGTFIWSTSWTVRGVVILASLMLIIKHVPNMKRLAQGTEPKVKFR